MQQSNMTGKPLVESDRVDGTDVYGANGESLGSVRRMMIDKMSGKVAYVVISFGGFLGLGAEDHTLPWGKLTYDPSLGGFRTDVTEEQLKKAPGFYRQPGYEWNDRAREQELHAYWNERPYWGF